MLKNTQNTIYVEARDLTTGARSSGLTVTATISKDGGSLAATTNSPAELGTSGVYALTLTATETNANTIAVVFSTTTTGVFLPLVVLDTEVAAPTVAAIQTGLAKTTDIPSALSIASNVLGRDINSLETIS